MPLVLLYTCVTIISHTCIYIFFFSREYTENIHSTIQIISYILRAIGVCYFDMGKRYLRHRKKYTYIFTELDIYTSSERYICSCAMFWLATIHLVLQNFRNFRTNIVNPACYVQRYLD